jgi:hypothetical protein
MKWYWILLLIVGVQGLFLLVWWLINRRTGSADLIKKLSESSDTRLQEELAAEKKAKATVSDAYKTLASKYKEVASWYTENKDKIEENADDSFKELANDPDAIDAWLDDLLKPSSE